MSTILKALRRLEEDSPAHAPRAPVTADGELRERILAEDSAAHIGQPDTHADGARNGLPGDSFAASLGSLLVPRTLTPIALGLVLVLCLAAGVWYWTGGAESLSPETVDPPIAAVAPHTSDPARSPSAASAPSARSTPSAAADTPAPAERAPDSTAAARAVSIDSTEGQQVAEADAPSAAPLAAETSGPAASQGSEREVAAAEGTADPSDGASDDASGRTSAPMPIPVAAVVVQKDEQKTTRTTGPARTSRSPSAHAPPAAEPALAPSHRVAAAPAPAPPSRAATALKPTPGTTASSSANPMGTRGAASSVDGSSLEPAVAAPSPPPAPEKTRIARAESAPSTASEPSVSRAAPSARPFPSAGESRPAAGRPAVSAAAGSPREVERLDRRGQLDVSVVGTSWHPTAERRSAKVRLLSNDELLTLREGDAVGAFVVQEISPSAVVFSAGEVEIRRRLGQSAAR
jgi:hypothetical protein